MDTSSYSAKVVDFLSPVSLSHTRTLPNSLFETNSFLVSFIIDYFFTFIVFYLLN